MWGEVKFWLNRYKAWVFVIGGLGVLTLGFILFSRFSTDGDRQMARQAEQVEETREVVAEQQRDALGDSEFSEKVRNLPTESELIAFLDTHAEELGEDVYTNTEANDLIESEFGKPVRTLAEYGYIISDGLTADQRMIIQMYQEQVLLSWDEITQDELVSVIVDTPFNMGVPKAVYNPKNYLGQRLVVNSYSYGIFDAQEKEVSEFSLYNHDNSSGDISVGYNIEEPVNFGDIELVGGLVAKGTEGSTGQKAMYTYLVFKPTKKMSGAEYYDAIGALNVTLNGGKISFAEYGSSIKEDVPAVYPVQITDSVFYYVDEDGYDENDDVTLTVGGEDIPLTVVGTDFEIDIES